MGGSALIQIEIQDKPGRMKAFSDAAPAIIIILVLELTQGLVIERNTLAPGGDVRPQARKDRGEDWPAPSALRRRCNPGW